MSTFPPPGRATAVAPANIAFVKYWGARDLERAVPVNPSLSMTLSACVSRTTVEFRPEDGGEDGGEPGDEVWLGSFDAPDGWRDPGPRFRQRVAGHLEALRRWRGLAPGAGRFRVVTENSFPAAAGMASSASGFAALAVATAAALGATPDPGELSALARASGSGSASRSVLGGYVEWPAPGTGGSANDPRAAQLAPASHWDLRDVVAVVEEGAKEVSSLEGHRRAPTSPYFERRLGELPRRLDAVRRAVGERHFPALAEVLEEEAVDLHLIAMSSHPPIFYWRPATLAVLAAVRELRGSGVDAASTMDAGANVHVICTPEAEAAVVERLEALPGVRSLVRDRVGTGPTMEVQKVDA